MAFLLARAILIAFLMISCTKAIAQTPIIGLGSQRCSAWTANSSASGGGVGLLYQQWIYGFLSSSAERDPDLLKDIDDANAIKRWLDNYCQDNSTARLVEAARAFVSARRP